MDSTVRNTAKVRDRVRVRIRVKVGISRIRVGVLKLPALLLPTTHSLLSAIYKTISRR